MGEEYSVARPPLERPVWRYCCATVSIVSLSCQSLSTVTTAAPPLHADAAVLWSKGCPFNPVWKSGMVVLKKKKSNSNPFSFFLFFLFEIKFAANMLF